MVKRNISVDRTRHAYLNQRKLNDDRPGQIPHAQGLLSDRSIDHTRYNEAANDLEKLRPPVRQDISCETIPSVTLVLIQSYGARLELRTSRRSAHHSLR